MNIRMSTKGKRPMRSLTPSDKIHAIQRIHDGESKASVARDIGVPESTLRGWCKNEDKLRFMSRQSAADKMSTDALTEKLDSASALLSGPPEKRQKVDNSLPLNFSNKIKYEEFGYKRSPLNGLDFSTNKGLADLSFNGLAADYASFNGSAKNKGYGADITRQNDPSMAAISPLSSLSHLSGLTGLSHSPLAISFNELTSNLNLLAQLNPGLAAMSGLNGLASTANQLRNVKAKAPPQMHSPRSEGSDRQQGLSVKNWAKQKTPISSSNELSFGLNLTQSDTKSKMKCPSPSLAPSMGNNMQIPAIPEDPLLYWLKSQQAMLGLNSLYPPPPPPPPVSASSPPIRSSTPQQIPLASTPLTPSSTPSGSLDDKNSAWFNWCKAFGASLTSLGPAAVAAVHPMVQPATSTTMDGSNTINNQKPPYENILYSHLTKDTSSPSVHSSSSVENMHNEIIHNTDSAGKPEDLSAKSTKTSSTPPSPLPTPAHSPIVNPQSPGLVLIREKIPISNTDAPQNSGQKSNEGRGVADCKDVLDNLLFKINSNNPNTSLSRTATPVSTEAVSDSDASYNGDSLHNNNDLSTTNNNNNNNSNKTDEEEKVKGAELLESASASDDLEAIQHGEKFLKWLENCSNPRVTAVQLMQLRFLISAIKSGNTGEQKIGSNEDQNCSETVISTETVAMIDDSPEESSRTKLRRRK